MKKIIEYKNHIVKLFDKIIEQETSKIEKAGELMAKTIENQKNLYVFGASHAGIISEELFYRAGGLAVINPIFHRGVMLDKIPITDTSVREAKENFGLEVFRSVPLKKGDTVLLHSVSGRNPATIGFAIEAKKIGANVIVITNLNYSKSVSSKHSSGKKLFEVANIVIDNHGEKGDASIKFDSIEQKTIPTSSLTGILIANSMVLETIEKLILKKIDPPIFYSANLDGGLQKNKDILVKYKNNIFFM